MFYIQNFDSHANLDFILALKGICSMLKLVRGLEGYRMHGVQSGITGSVCCYGVQSGVTGSVCCVLSFISWKWLRR